MHIHDQKKIGEIFESFWNAVVNKHYQMMAYHKSCFNIGELHTTENESIPSVSSSSQEINEKLKQKEKEIDILKKCKEELSNTVITLKQEIYSLREEKLKMDFKLFYVCFLYIVYNQKYLIIFRT